MKHHFYIAMFHNQQGDEKMKKIVLMYTVFLQYSCSYWGILPPWPMICHRLI